MPDHDLRGSEPANADAPPSMSKRSRAAGENLRRAMLSATEACERFVRAYESLRDSHGRGEAQDGR